MVEREETRRVERERSSHAFLFHISVPLDDSSGRQKKTKKKNSFAAQIVSGSEETERRENGRGTDETRMSVSFRSLLISEEL